jgi:SWI/SNF-related matrix-associated actin-dependent regulator of chromatin subfamily A3
VPNTRILIAFSFALVLLTSHFEAHHIGNRSSQVYQAACDLKASRRWCLTGTPIKNSLDNYGALLSFLQIPPFTQKSQFDKWIVKPIEGRNKKSLSRLQDLVHATCLRRTQKTASQSVKLPDLTMVVQNVEMNEAERELYAFFEKYTADIASKSHGSHAKPPANMGHNILPLMNFLRRICDHGLQLLPPAAVDAWNRREERTIDWDVIQRCRKKCDSCRSDMWEDTDEVEVLSELRCGHLIGSCCSPQSGEDVLDRDDDVSCPACTNSNRNLRTVGGDQSQSPTDTRLSSKLEALLRNIKQEQQLNHTSASTDPIKR